MRSLRELQQEQLAWRLRNFGETPVHQAIYGATEELGELCHAELKLEQGIRGNREELEEEARDAVADTIIFLVDYCNKKGYDLEDLLFSTWDEVKKRDWKKFPKNGISE